jgi:hypothetical protein
MADRRKTKRRHLIYYLRVFNRITNELIGHVVDITSDGVMMICENPLEVGTVLNLRMVLPIETGRDSIDLEGKVMRSARDVNPDFFAVGIQLLDIKPEDVELIQGLIKQFGFNL